MRYILSILVLIMVFVSCKRPEFTFDSSQPIDVREQKNISNRLVGVYESVDDSSTLNVSNNFILKSGFYEEGMNIKEIDSTLKLVGDTLIEIKTNNKVFVIRIGDSISWKQKYIDTIFSFQRKDIIKKFKGYYFINKYYPDLGWEVKKIKLRKGLLSISDISSEKDISKLESILESKFDTISNKPIKLSKKDFKKFLKLNGFENDEVYVKKYSR